MKMKMNKVLAVFAGLLVAGLVVPAMAQNTGAVTISTTVTTLDGLNNTSLWDTVFEDQSTYPHQSKRHGTIIRVYDWGKDGGAAGTISLERGTVVTNVPDNTIIVGGFVDVITPLLGTNISTNALGVNASGDLLAATGTTLTNIGIATLIPDLSAVTNSVVKLTNNMPLNLVHTGSTITQGHFVVYLDVYYGQ